MKQIINFLTIAFIFVFLQSCSNQLIRVACVGDSITEGDGLKDRANEAYPAILSQLLDKHYKVINLGQSGATLIKKGDWPYWNKIAYKNALAIEPNVFIILLGANDSKPQNIPAHMGDFISDLREMVDNFQQLSSHPRIYLCTPIPAFANRFNISDAVLISDVIPAVQKVASEKNCKIIDLHTAFQNRTDILGDGVHPNKQGAAEIAKYISSQIK